MGNKLEKLYERLTGINPNSLEPKPSAAQQAKAIQAQKKFVLTNCGQRAQAMQPDIFHFELVETDHEMPAYGSPPRPFSIICRVHDDGKKEFTFVWGQSVSRDEVDQVGSAQSVDAWFELNDNCKL